jgi:hypothetical protein
MTDAPLRATALLLAAIAAAAGFAGCIGGGGSICGTGTSPLNIEIGNELARPVTLQVRVVDASAVAVFNASQTVGAGGSETVRNITAVPGNYTITLQEGSAQGSYHGGVGPCFFTVIARVSEVRGNVTIAMTQAVA